MQGKHIKFEVDYKKFKVFDEFNVEDIKYPIVLSSPHAGTVFPEEFLANSMLSVEELRDSEDCYVTELVKKASDAGIPLLSLNVHRTFIDVNRDKLEIDETMYFDKPGKVGEINLRRCRYGLGIIHRVVAQHKEIYGGLLSYEEVNERFDKVYNVYHKRLQQLVSKVKKKFGFCLVIDCHSMPSKICSIMNESKMVDFCIGNLFGESAPEEISLFLQKNLEDRGYRVELNRPYIGAFITLNYCQPRKKQFTLHLEVNKGLYMQENVYKKTNNFQSVSNDLASSIVELGDFLLDF